MDEKIIALAKAIAILAEAQKSRPQQLLDRLNKAEKNMDAAISKVDTIKELVGSIGSGILNLIIQLGTGYIKKVGPVGLAEIALKGTKEVADFLNGGDQDA